MLQQHVRFRARASVEDLKMMINTYIHASIMVGRLGGSVLPLVIQPSGTLSTGERRGDHGRDDEEHRRPADGRDRHAPLGIPSERVQVRVLETALLATPRGARRH